MRPNTAPVRILWFGTGIGGPVLVIFTGAFPPCVINAYRGARYVDPLHIEAALTLGANHWQIITEVLLPASVPSIVSPELTVTGTLNTSGDMQIDGILDLLG